MLYKRVLTTVFMTILLSSTLFAQNFDVSKVEKKAKEKYLKDSSKKEYRYQDNTFIGDEEYIDGNVVVVKGNLTLRGQINGDILVVNGDIRLKNDARVDGNVTAVDGRIYQDRNTKINGNQIETHARNLFPKDDWDYDYDSDYDYDYDYNDDEWDWSWSKRFYGSYSTLPIKDVDDAFVLRYNRVQGLFIGPGIPKWIGGKYNYFTLHGFAGYGFMEKKWRYQLGLDRWLFDQRTYRFEIGAKIYDLTDSRDDWLLSMTENSLASFFLKDDYHDFYRRTGYEVHASQNFTIFLKGTIAYRNDEYQSVARHAQWSLFNGDDRFRENPAIEEGKMRSLYGEIYFDTRDNIQLPRKGWYGLLAIESSNKKHLKSDFSFNQYSLEIRRYQTFGFRERLDIRLKAGSAEGTLPVQKIYQMGGPSTLRGFNYKSLAGDRMLLANFEYNLNPRIFSTDLLFLDELNYILFYDIGNAWFSNPLQDNKWYEGFDNVKFNTLKSDIGMAITFDDGKYRISMAKRLDSGLHPLSFSLRIVKPF
ncbi:MAG: BamA/TamA family outer membrane protein [Calditrichae bacterium]|nr:BamA/TamA family outer membrane protein [Calditrichota bacterium]MCB9058091.1 BamA/TamA family outer membrane protein [Calditrichia bacterium]